MAYRITYDGGKSHDALPSDTLTDALERVRQAIKNGVHTSATIEVISGDGPGRVMGWLEVSALL